MLGENFGDGHAGSGFNCMIGIGEIQTQPLRQPPSDRAFASPHHADQHHGSTRQSLFDPQGLFGLAGFIGCDLVHTRHPNS